MKKYIYYSLIGLAAVLFGCEAFPTFELPQLETWSASNVTYNSAVLHGSILNDVPENSYVRRGFDISLREDMSSSTRIWCDSRKVQMTYANMHDIQADATGLNQKTTYYFRVVIDKEEYRSAPIYGNVQSFKTKEKPEDPVPSISATTEVISYAERTVRLSASCKPTNCTLKEMGILMSKSGTPTRSSYDGISDPITSTSGLWNWWGLTPGTKYYFRSYAIDNYNNTYYGNTVSCTTKTEPGGSLTVNDFIGTYTMTAYEPWRGSYIDWTDVQIIPYNGDTVVAVGFDGRDELRAVGIFYQGMQVIRFESEWYFDAYSFNYNGNNCIAMFMPVYFDESSNAKAYTISNGGIAGRGEIWLQYKSGSYSFTSPHGDDFDGHNANGFIFDYYSTSDWTKQGNSEAYTQVTMTRTATTTNRAMPSRIRKSNLTITSHENENDHNSDTAVRIEL